MAFTCAQVVTPEMSRAGDDAIAYDALHQRVSSVTAGVFICDDLTVDESDEDTHVVGIRG
jgi:hypothetical protein